MKNDEDDDSVQVNLGGGECPPGLEALNEPRQFDFSQAHFLDHSLWECVRDKGQPNRVGGVVTHVRYAWAYRWSWELASRTLCVVGRHHPVKRAMRDDPSKPFKHDVGCRNCGIHLSSQETK